MSFDNENARFLVVINHEQQYSIWPEYKAIPEGWSAVGVSGDKATCLAHIEEVWTCLLKTTHDADEKPG